MAERDRDGLSVARAARLIGIDRKTLAGMCDRGEVACKWTKVGRRRMRKISRSVIRSLKNVGHVGEGGGQHGQQEEAMGAQNPVESRTEVPS